MTLHPLHRCPRCHGALAEGEDPEGDGRVRCDACAERWPLLHGVPFLGPTDYRFPIEGIDPSETGPVDPEAVPEGIREWVRHAGRADAVLLALPDAPGAVVLDVGCGYGGVSFPLARVVREVHAMDPTPASVGFVAERARREGEGRVVAAGGEALALPYADASFDAVLLNGVLEWVPLARPELPPVEAQRRALAEAARVLSPGGVLYLAIENRFALRYLAGARDEHTGLRWVTPLPRALADRYHRARRGGAPYRAWTHGPRRLARLAREVGLTPVDWLGPLRDYRLFRFVVPMRDRRGLALLARHSMPFPSLESKAFVALARVATALRLPSRLTDALFPSVAMVARRAHGATAAPSGGSGFSDLLDALGLAGGRVRLALSGARRLTLFVDGARPGDAGAVVRWHRGEGPNRARAEHALLAALGASGGALARSVPAALAHAPWGGGEAFAVSMLDARPVGAPRRTGRALALLGELRAWLDTLVRAPAPPGLPEEPSASAFLAEQLGQVPRLSRRGRARLDGLVASARELDRYPRVLCHFDLGPDNVLRGAGGIAVVDWEYARTAAVGYDWFRLVTRVAIARAGAPPDLSTPLTEPERVLGPVSASFFGGGPWARRVRDETLAHLALAGVDLRLADAAMRVELLRYLVRQLPWVDAGAPWRALLEDRSTLEGVGTQGVG